MNVNRREAIAAAASAVELMPHQQQLLNDMQCPLIVCRDCEDDSWGPVAMLLHRYITDGPMIYESTPNMREPSRVRQVFESTEPRSVAVDWYTFSDE